MGKPSQSDQGAFLASGCLSSQGLMLYVQDRLAMPLRAKAEAHAATCALCHDAIAGAAAWPGAAAHGPENEGNFADKLAEINQQIAHLTHVSPPAARPRARKRNQAFTIMLASAASVALLIGLFFAIRPFVADKEVQLANEQTTNAQSRVQKEIAQLQEESKETESEMPGSIKKNKAPSPVQIYPAPHPDEAYVEEDQDGANDSALAESNDPEGQQQLKSDVGGVAGTKKDVRLEKTEDQIAMPEEVAITHTETKANANKALARATQQAPSAASPTVGYQAPEFPGGEDGIQQYVHNRWNEFNPQAQLPAEISIRLLVGADGKVQSATFPTATDLAITKTLKDILLQMPAWKAASRDGVNCSATVEMTLRPGK